MAKPLSAFPPTIPSLLTTLFLFSTTVSSNFYTDINLSYGEQNIKILDNGHLLQLNLDNVSGSGFESKHHYLFGIFHMQIKLVAGNSAGTVTTFYLSSEGSTHDEIDFEFLGNVSGEPYVLHTNVFTQGEGNREQEFYLWFDPRADFHNYSVLWNLKQILFFVDGTPIRVFKNLESSGVPYPKYQPMKLYSSLWNGDEWATRGGLVKIDWSQAPFTASYRNFTTDACIWYAGKTSCSTSGGSPPRRWWNRALDSKGEEKIKRVQREYMIYNYCVDTKKFPRGFPPECYL